MCCAICSGNTHLLFDSLLYPVKMSSSALPLDFTMKQRSVAWSMLKSRDTSRSGTPALNAAAARFITSTGTLALSVFRT